MTKIIAILVTVLFSLSIGCGSSDPTQAAKVTGKVTFDGKSLTGGTITVFNAGRPYLGAIGPDGTYRLSAPTGICQVSIECRAPSTPDKSPNANPSLLVPGKSLIPDKYLSTSTSGLSFEAKPGTNTANFDLTD